MTLAMPDRPRSTAAWEVLPLGANAWRICDSAREPMDPSRLVAYMDRSDTGSLDVLWLRSPCPTRSRYRDLDELLADLDAAAAEGRVSRSVRPQQISHFPPVR
jgi:hypothetical protein